MMISGGSCLLFLLAGFVTFWHVGARLGDGRETPVGAWHNVFTAVKYLRYRHIAPWIPSPLRHTPRRGLVSELEAARAAGYATAAARVNAQLAQEAFERAWRTMQAWSAARDPASGLLPRRLETPQPFWNGKDTAADLLPFLLTAGLYLDDSAAPVWLTVMAQDRHLSGPLPRRILFRPTRFDDESPAEIVFGASEYAKDGLLALAERFGRGPWFDRLEEIMTTLVGGATVDTPYGRICASDTEVNGEMLQVLCRLYWATGHAPYLAMAERIGDAYFLEILPHHHELPAHDWDFATDTAANPKFRLRDHGSEIVPGLTELYVLEKLQGRPRAAQYRPALQRMLDRLLHIGRSADGLWVNAVDPADGRILSGGVIDTWGYIANAYQAFDLVEGTTRYRKEIERAMRAAAARRSFPWEGRHMDGHADSLESMIYLLPWFDLPECRHWVDDEMEVLFARQQPDGLVEADYLDGNFIRTTLLYALYKTAGVRFDPWRADLQLGAEWRPDTGTLHVHLASAKPWSGVIRFDIPRHREYWNLPLDYPRLNSSPEWFTVEREAAYILQMPGEPPMRLMGAALAAGVPVRLVGGGAVVQWTVRRQR
ncbi:MAG: hypothetical protein JXQ27_04930 [Acidobacteria bacterium]|nr:hypothetical protein [Acidobacteriota bacterium]